MVRRLLHSMFFIFLLQVVCWAETPPFFMPRTGFLSLEYYYIRNDEGIEIRRVGSWLNRTIHTINSKGIDICSLSIHPDEPDLLSFCVRKEGQEAWSVAQLNLQTGKENLALPYPIPSCIPFNLYYVGQPLGYLLNCESAGVQRFTSESTTPIQLSPERSRGIWFDPIHDSAWWFYSKDLPVAWDIVGCTMETVDIYEFPLPGGDIKKTSLSFAQVEPRVSYIYAVYREHETLCLLANGVSGHSDRNLFSVKYDLRTKEFLDKRAIDAWDADKCLGKWSLLQISSTMEEPIYALYDFAADKVIQRFTEQPYNMVLKKDGNLLVLFKNQIKTIPLK